MKAVLLQTIPRHVARRGTNVCPLCDTEIPVYDIDHYEYAIPNDVTWSRIAGDSAYGYELIHHGCLDKEDNK